MCNIIISRFTHFRNSKTTGSNSRQQNDTRDNNSRLAPVLNGAGAIDNNEVPRDKILRKRVIFLISRFTRFRNYSKTRYAICRNIHIEQICTLLHTTTQDGRNYSRRTRTHQVLAVPLQEHYRSLQDQSTWQPTQDVQVLQRTISSSAPVRAWSSPQPVY